MADAYFTRPTTERDVTVISTRFLNDPGLSWKAKGLMAYLLSLPADWKIRLAEVQRHSTDGMSGLRSAIQELIDSGYVRSSQERDNSGKWTTFVYEIIEVPSPRCDFPQAGKPEAGLPEAGNRTLSNTQIDNTQIKESKDQIDKVKVAKPAPDLRSTIKRGQKQQDAAKIRILIDQFTSNVQVRDKLHEYLSIRRKKGLSPVQWGMILDDLRSYAKEDADLAIEKINNAIAGGYMQIIAPWEKDQQRKAAAPRFDNTINHAPQAAIDLDPQTLQDSLATDETGNLLKF